MDWDRDGDRAEVRDDDSVTEWVDRVKAGSMGDPARRLWDRYFERLARLAQGLLRQSGRRACDGEDVALNALECFFRGAAVGRFPRLADRNDLWKVLVTITARKASNQRREEQSRKRGGGRVVLASELAADDKAGGDPLARLAATEPSPEFAVAVIDEIRRRFSALPDPTLRVVARLRFEGYTNTQIATALDCSVRTIERALDEIRGIWEREETF
jgi:DNA-directed RNA polymerase specialized sigma24 family protein